MNGPLDVRPDIGAAVLRYRSDIVRHIRELIRIRSVAGAPRPGMPFGEGPALALEYMLKLGRSLGFRSANADGYAGHLEYGAGEEMAAILVHLDTVPEGVGWTVDPLGGDLIGGRIYGRGAADDKGPAVASLFAMKAFADLGIAPRRRLRLILGTNEESGMTDMDAYFAREPLPDYGFSPDAGYPVINAEKGINTVELRWKRRPAAGAAAGSAEGGAPEFGIHADSEALGTSGALEPAGTTGCEPGGAGGVLEPARTGQRRGGLGADGFRVVSMEGGTAPNVVPDSCRATVEAGEHAERALLRAAAGSERVTAERDADGRIAMTATGKSGHGSYPPSGVNAIAHMAAFLAGVAEELTPAGAGQASQSCDDGQTGRGAGLAAAEGAADRATAFLAGRIGFEAFGESLGIACSDATHGQLTVNLAEAALDAGEARIVLNIRVPVVFDGEAILSQLGDRLRADGAELTVLAALPPLYVPPDHPLVRKLSRAYETVTGERAKLLSIGGGTYARKLQGRGVAFGAGFPGGPDNNVHQPDEFVVVDDMMRHCRVCLQAIYELVGMPDM